jgi:hypothetical protein
MMFWSGYERRVWAGPFTGKVWLRRGRCKPCGKTHVLLPSFLLKWRLYVSATIGELLEEAVTRSGGLRPVAQDHGIPHSTAREWVRDFSSRARDLVAGFAAAAVGLGGTATHSEPNPARSAIRAIRSAWHSVMSFPGWIGIGIWGFASAACGGTLVATNTSPLFLVVGKRRFMVPVA